MEIYWILIILSIVVALNADKIDEMVYVNKKAKKLLIAFCCASILIGSYVLITIFI